MKRPLRGVAHGVNPPNAPGAWLLLSLWHRAPSIIPGSTETRTGTSTSSIRMSRPARRRACAGRALSRHPAEDSSHEESSQTTAFPRSPDQPSGGPFRGAHGAQRLLDHPGGHRCRGRWRHRAGPPWNLLREPLLSRQGHYSHRPVPRAPMEEERSTGSQGLAE